MDEEKIDYIACVFLYLLGLIGVGLSVNWFASASIFLLLWAGNIENGMDD